MIFQKFLQLVRWVNFTFRLQPEPPGKLRRASSSVRWPVWTNRVGFCSQLYWRIAAIFLLPTKRFQKFRLFQRISGDFFCFFPLRGKQSHACSMTSGPLSSNAVDLKECSSNLFTLVRDFQYICRYVMFEWIIYTHVYFVFTRVVSPVEALCQSILSVNTVTWLIKVYL